MNLDDVAARLAERLRHMKVAQAPNSIQLTTHGWSILMDLDAEPHVAAESAQIAVRFGMDRPDREQLAVCDARIEVAADPDPQNEYFGEFSAALDVLQRLGCVLFDPATCQFI